MLKNFLFICVLGAIFFASCGDDPAEPVLSDTIIGTWAQVLSTNDCEVDSLDTSVDFVCDDINCQTLTFGDSSLVTTILSDGNTVVISEFYRFTDDNQLEICDGTEFNSTCDSPLMITINNNRLVLRGAEELVNIGGGGLQLGGNNGEQVRCSIVREYVRVSTGDMGGG